MKSLGLLASASIRAPRNLKSQHKLQFRRGGGQKSGSQMICLAAEATGAASPTSDFPSYFGSSFVSFDSFGSFGSFGSFASTKIQ
jgi:hypothetical protein